MSTLQLVQSGSLRIRRTLTIRFESLLEIRSEGTDWERKFRECQKGSQEIGWNDGCDQDYSEGEVCQQSENFGNVLEGDHYHSTARSCTLKELSQLCSVL